VRRRDLIAGGLATAAELGASQVRAGGPQDDWRQLEVESGGRLGFWLSQCGADRSDDFGYRENERFLMCSTFKALAVATILHKVDRGSERLDRWIPYGQRDLQEYAPVTKAHVRAGGMSLNDLCAAAVELSDNTAANLILASLGGPAGVTRYIRSLGDRVTRLDRSEPELNHPHPGQWDTTTPKSMVELWNKIVVESALSQASRSRLNGWLAGCQTGAQRLPAAIPKGWRIGHKTGSGKTTIGDVAVITRPNQPQRPYLLAVYLDVPNAPSDAHDAIIAKVGRWVFQFLGVA
jgi:beta-lactamase class A